MKLDPFYPLVDSSDWVARLVPLGVKLVQLRIKDRPRPEIRAEIARSSDVCARLGCQLVVNDYWEEAIAEGCDFVHLGQEDLAEADLKAIRCAGLRLGVSTHDGDELERALSVDPEYIALGPVFPTGSKELSWQPQGLERIAGWRRQTGNIPLVAIGGITLETCSDVYRSGANSIAVIGDVLRHDKPEQRARDWLATSAPWRS
ncbi:thiamine phosphate synthase [Rhodobacterales bacterium]|nr:thiamine phosphate synthase [Rhodobacterales bacterium]